MDKLFYLKVSHFIHLITIFTNLISFIVLILIDDCFGFGKINSKRRNLKINFKILQKFIGNGCGYPGLLISLIFNVKPL